MLRPGTPNLRAQLVPKRTVKVRIRQPAPAAAAAAVAVAAAAAPAKLSVPVAELAMHSNHVLNTVRCVNGIAAT